MSKPKKAKSPEVELTASEREALIAEVALVVRGAALVAAERGLAAVLANRNVKRRLQDTDPKARQQRATRALASHPRATQILDSVDFRDPTPRERETAASLKDRALKVRARHAAP